MPDSTSDRDLWHAGYMTGLGEAFDFLLALPGEGKYELLRQFHASLGIRGPEATYEVWHLMMANPVFRQHYHLFRTKGT